MQKLTYLITGGSGFLGRELVRQMYNDAKKIIIYSRSESKQAEMKVDWPEYPDNVMRYLIGDVRDKERLVRACRHVDVVIHAAALKRVEVCAYDVGECISTNVAGTMNVVDACNANHVSKCIFISTDKAVEPITTYGKSKALAEDIITSGNNYGSCRFASVRYANVEGSTGSLLTIWGRQAIRKDPLTITDRRMTRMFISVQDAAEFVLSMLHHMQGGEVFVPHMTGIRIFDLCQQSYGSDVAIVETGIRPGEKLHECLISESDARDLWGGTYGKSRRVFYTIYPAIHDWIAEYKQNEAWRGLARLPESFRLSSRGLPDEA